MKNFKSVFGTIAGAFTLSAMPFLSLADMTPTNPYNNNAGTTTTTNPAQPINPNTPIHNATPRANTNPLIPPQSTTSAPLSQTHSPGSSALQQQQEAQIRNSRQTVVDAQQALVLQGYPITADGHNGPLTQSAIREFQAKNALPQSGMLDAETLRLLNVQPAPLAE